MKKLTIKLRPLLVRKKKEEKEKLNQSVNRQSPYGNTEWQRDIIEQLGLQHTIRPRGRPKKDERSVQAKKEDSQLF